MKVVPGREESAMKPVLLTFQKKEQTELDYFTSVV